MEINKIYNIDFLNNNLPDKCANLIIADPPYFEVKGKFDFIWGSFDEYLKDVEKWAIECKRLLSDNGTLFWWGDKNKIAYSQIILDKLLKLESSLIWRKKDSIQYQYYSPENARTFNSHNERLLMYSNFSDDKDNCFSIYLKDEFKKANLKKADVSKLFPSKTGRKTGCVTNWLNGLNIITEEQYLKIRKHVNNEYFKKSYYDLLKNYNNEKRYFHNPKKIEEVLEFSQESHITKNYAHETKKPETLTRNLILTCSRENDLILVPFSGSGTECAMAVKENRSFIGFDIEKKYVDMGNERVNKLNAQQKLFTPQEFKQEYKQEKLF